MPESPRTDDRHRRPASLLGAVAVTVVVVVVVGVAVLAAGSEGTGDDTIPQAGIPDTWIDAMLVGLMLTGVLVLFLMVVAQLRNREPGGGGPTMTNRYLLGAMLLIGVIVGLRYLAGDAELPEPAPVEEGVGGEQGSDDDSDDESPALWPLLLALGFGAAAVGAVPLVRHLTARDEGDAAEHDAHQLAARRDRLIGLLDDAIDDLRRHPDHREAVIAAWARLEDAFELVGLERLPSDTPLRQLARALDTVDASAPAVEALTRAFERAMFSAHPIDRATHLVAVDALVAVRDELHVSSRAAVGAS